MYPYQALTQQIIAAAISVHRQLGPGLLESVYRCCLALELEHLGIAYQKEIEMPLRFRETVIQRAFRLDFLVESNVILEIKSVSGLLPVHEAQLLTYLKFTRASVGLLINFHVPLLKEGIRRFIFTQNDSMLLGQNGSHCHTYTEGEGGAEVAERPL